MSQEFDIDAGNDFIVDNTQEFQKDTDETPKEQVNTEEPKSALTGGNKPFTGSVKEKAINLFEDEVTGKPIDFGKLKTDKAVLIAIANEDDKIPEEINKELVDILRTLAKKDYKIRSSCRSNKQVLPLIDSLFDYEDIEVYKPWKKFCTVKGFKTFTPTNKNIEAAAYYSKDFNKRPTAVKHIISSFFQSLFGSNNDSVVEYIIIYDPHLKKNDKGYETCDYKLSPGTSDIHFLSYTIKEKPFNIYNINKPEDIKILKEVIS